MIMVYHTISKVKIGNGTIFPVAGQGIVKLGTISVSSALHQLALFHPKLTLISLHLLLFFYTSC